MKLLSLSIALFVLSACTKEKISPTIPGTWTIVESNIGTGTGYSVQTYLPSSEITLEFMPNGNLSVSGNNPGTAMSPLCEFDKYKITADNKVRFFQSAGTKEMEAFYTLNGDL